MPGCDGDRARRTGNRPTGPGSVPGSRDAATDSSASPGTDVQTLQAFPRIVCVSMGAFV
jgi:hypothetical protein